MQSLDVISVNLWQILISLANLTIIFLIVKKFLFKPVKNILAKRQAELDEQYSKAYSANENAQSNMQAWEEKMKSADDEADDIIKKATDVARRRGDKIVEEAKDKADGIIRQAETEAELERKKAEDDIKREIVDVSTSLAQQMIGRELNQQDHRRLIDAFIEGIGDSDDRNE